MIRTLTREERDILLKKDLGENLAAIFSKIINNQTNYGIEKIINSQPNYVNYVITPDKNKNNESSRYRIFLYFSSDGFFAKTYHVALYYHDLKLKSKLSKELYNRLTGLFDNICKAQEEASKELSLRELNKLLNIDLDKQKGLK